MEKRELRQTVIGELKAQDSELKKKKDKQLLQELVATKAYQDSQVIATYLAFDFEYDTSLLIEQAKRDGKLIVVPKTYPKGRMIFGLYDEKQLAPTRFGLMEPVSDEAFDKNQIDLIHVPGVVFNGQGFRVGYGAGYYDRYLSDYRGTTISTIYDFQMADFKSGTHDIAVKEVLVK